MEWGRGGRECSDLYGRLAVVCVGGWQWFVWEAGSGLCGRLAVGDLYGSGAVVCMGANHGDSYGREQRSGLYGREP